MCDVEAFSDRQAHGARSDPDVQEVWVTLRCNQEVRDDTDCPAVAHVWSLSPRESRRWRPRALQASTRPDRRLRNPVLSTPWPGCGWPRQTRHFRMIPSWPARHTYRVDGRVVLMSPLTQLGPRSVQFNSTPAGVCERHDEHTGHVTAVQMLTDVDGQTFIDDASLTVITIQDVAGWTSMGYGRRSSAGTSAGPTKLAILMSSASTGRSIAIRTWRRRGPGRTKAMRLLLPKRPPRLMSSPFNGSHISGC
jgi:hypothetical protein